MARFQSSMQTELLQMAQQFSWCVSHIKGMKDKKTVGFSRMERSTETEITPMVG